MAVPSSASPSNTTLCSHCERDVPTSNFDLHRAHCIRNLERCTLCGDMIPKRGLKNITRILILLFSCICSSGFHPLTSFLHSTIACSLCGEFIERELLAIHERDKCLQRIVICSYCEFPLPAAELGTHQDTCGNRTEFCNPCGKYVRLCEKLAHDLQLHEANSDGSGAPSRAHNGENDHRSSEPSRRVPRGQPHDFSQRKLLFTFAFAGIAIMIGSFVLQRRNTNQQQ